MITAAQGTLFNVTFYGLLFAMSLLLQQGRGLIAVASGLLLLPLTGLIPIGSLCAASVGPLLGADHADGHGFVLCVTVGAAATSAALALTALSHPAQVRVHRA